MVPRSAVGGKQQKEEESGTVIHDLRFQLNSKVNIHIHSIPMLASALRTSATKFARTAFPTTRRFTNTSTRLMSVTAGSDKIVLVTGSTGRVGKEVVARLSQIPGFTVRAATRDKAEYATSLGAHETVAFDLEDDKTWAPAMQGVTHLFSSTQDKFIGQHMAFAKWCGETESIKKNLHHVVRVSCFGADTNTNAYDSETHVSRSNAGIPLMLQHYWWSEECFIAAGFGKKLTVIRGNFYMSTYDICISQIPPTVCFPTQD